MPCVALQDRRCLLVAQDSGSRWIRVRRTVRRKGGAHFLEGLDSSRKASSIRKIKIYTGITLDSSRMDLEFLGVVCKDVLGVDSIPSVREHSMSWEVELVLDGHGLRLLCLSP